MSKPHSLNTHLLCLSYSVCVRLCLGAASLANAKSVFFSSISRALYSRSACQSVGLYISCFVTPCSVTRTLFSPQIAMVTGNGGSGWDQRSSVTTSVHLIGHSLHGAVMRRDKNPLMYLSCISCIYYINNISLSTPTWHCKSWFIDFFVNVFNVL